LTIFTNPNELILWFSNEYEFRYFLLKKHFQW